MAVAGIPNDLGAVIPRGTAGVSLYQQGRHDAIVIEPPPLPGQKRPVSLVFVRKPEVADRIELMFGWPELRDATCLMADGNTAEQVLGKHAPMAMS